MRRARFALAAGVCLITAGGASAQNGSTALTNCNLAPFTPRSFPLGQIAILATLPMHDPNFRLTDAKAQCVDGSESVLDVCGTVSQMNAAGYVDRVVPFAGRFDLSGTPAAAAATKVRFGPAAKALCAKVMEPTPFAKSLIGQ